MKKIVDKKVARRMRNGSGLISYCPSRTTFARLVALFGSPTFGPEDSGDGKVQVEWVLKARNGAVLTVYDYRSYAPVQALVGHEWHIGGDRDKPGVPKAVGELIDLLAQ